MNNRTFDKGNKADRKADKPVKTASGFGAPEGERIAKRMARAGLCSRREAETWIEAGRVKVNGKLLTTPAFKVSERDRIEVDDKPISRKERTRLWLFHKPGGTVTTNHDPDGRKTVFELLPETLPRMITVGRLDINTEGLLLMTNDGGLARVLELPATGWLRRYRVRVHGRVTQQQLDQLQDGIAVDGVLYGSIHAVLEQEKGSNAWLNVALREGKNREIKNVMGHLGLEVTRLIRVSFGPFQLGDLPAGTVREVRSRTLREQLGEKLIEEAGADFEAPIINLAPDIARSATRAAMQGDKKSRRQAQKLKPGMASDEALSRLTTRPADGRKPAKGAAPSGKGKPGGRKAASGKRKSRPDSKR